MPGKAVAAVAGVATGVAGIVLGQKIAGRRKGPKIMGRSVPLPSTETIGQIAKQIGRAAEKVDTLAGEVHEVRKKAESIGKALS
jgi:hypothetical protein